ncbi:MAG: SDR family NAD(P)-dependent oxidoreductase [Alphaproteobacteria bacterium]|nr:SDR family NAD(P)-dependent oxidoreductase [Alphaproteobacteria bacterium]
MDGRICVVTGANSGLGRATAEGLARRGAHVVLLCRRPDAGAEAAEAVARGTGGSTELLVADLTDPAAIAAAARTLAEGHGRVDVLVNNAGLYLPRRRETPEGLEATFATNHLGAFRLTRHLLPLMPRDGRVVVVASRSHADGRLDPDDLQRRRRPYGGYAAYADSKLANVLFVRELARRLGPHPTVNAVHPGTIGTDWAQDEPGFMQRLFRVARPFMTTPAKGARGAIMLASDPALAELTGAYLSGVRPRRPARRARRDDDARRLWELSEALSPGLPPLPSPR